MNSNVPQLWIVDFVFDVTPFVLVYSINLKDKKKENVLPSHFFLKLLRVE